MKKTALIFLPSAVSHYNVVLGVAQWMQELDYEVTFAGTVSFKGIASEAGCRFITCDYVETFFDPVPSFPKEFFQTILANMTLKADDYRYSGFLNAIESISQLIDRLNPDVIMVDSILSVLSIIVKCLSPQKLILVEIMLSRYRAPLNPPLNSAYIPNENVAGKCLTLVAWNMASLKFKWRSIIKRTAYFGEDYKSLLKRWLKERGIKYGEVVNTKAAFGYLPKNTKQILLPSQHLEYPWHKSLPGQVYVGPIVNDYGRELAASLRGVIDEIKKGAEDRQIVYCSLGSISSVHSKKCKQFLTKVISAFQSSNNVLILSAGPELFDQLKSSSARNIHVFEKVSQLQVLTVADLMITHGGINSVTECVTYGVPMLVYPLNNSWDQKGNAARIVFHGLGLKGSFRHDSIEKIATKINTLLKHNRFREAVKRMAEKFSALDRGCRIGMFSKAIES